MLGESEFDFSEAIKELEFDCPEFERDLEELRNAEKCEPCDPDCEYTPLCRWIRGEYDE